MELKLYNYLRSNGLADEDVDFRLSSFQERLEKYDITLGLQIDILKNIKGYLKTYNNFLKSKKENEIKLRYYQILALYFTELYFNKKDEHGFRYSIKNLAYWMATGSGKTIIMHLNILQYISYCKRFKDFEIIMTTPGVNLIEQHERELTPYLSFLNQKHRNKIRLTIDTTSALLNKPDDFFNFPDSKNYKRLILVDEAHIGLTTTSVTGTDGAFMELRKRLNIKNSFLFEYSATFHNIKGELEKDYQKSIVYDYNYNLFFRDGYGKDYFFQQIGDDVLEKSFDDNLNHNLKIINQKLELWNNINYSTEKELFKATQFPDKPLIAFMGNTVNDKKKSAKNEDPEVSDITNIVNYLSSLSENKKREYKLIFNNQYSGKLNLTRNPDTDDEILLSFGNGDYWGIVNVGNGTKFINDLDNENVVKNARENIIVSNLDKYSFRKIDSPDSPINVLIGSRKFAEGWNCFRVSVIGLINLGSSKGNKIIQIFGRGVRIHGVKNDGKRTFSEHNEDYFSLKNDDEKDKLRKIETLCVFSLKKSYLETFTNAIDKELEIIKKYEIKVNPSIIKLNGNTKLHFEEYRKRIPVFKLSKLEIGQKRVSLNTENQSFKISFMQNGEIQNGTIHNFTIKLDYRPNKSDDGINIIGDINNFLNKYPAFINYDSVDNIIAEFQEDNQLYVSSNDSVLSVQSILGYINSITYKSSINSGDIDLIQNIINQVTSDFLQKLKNKVNWYINNSNYKFDELLNQSSETEKGDFIDRYYILKAIETTKEKGGKTNFRSKAEIESEIEDFENTIADIAKRLEVDKGDFHIYSPLLRETRKDFDDEKELKIIPDKLNAGERKFIEDVSRYFRGNKKYQDFEIYLMRNVESLKSIGIYLNDDSQVFFPDFILWLIKGDKVYINFIDPKGQMGIQDAKTLDENEKVLIADKDSNDTMGNIEKSLNEKLEKKFILNSFLLLRDSSEMGTKGISKTLDWQKTNMINKNIFRLNWHDVDENGATISKDKLPDGKNYLDWIFEKTFK